MPKILIVDDSSFMRVSIKTLLEKHGYEVIGEASNGAIGVELYKELKPDIVTMDITMPIMTGIEAVKAIKVFDANAKIIMLSAMGQEGLIRDSIIAGAKTFIVKPFKEAHFLDILKKLC
ncbi:response regulator [Serpentinicella alkaliphila]|uniref:Stage 0 sporulation protein A homolog n=1 Tax=Serpentinicella alkaliphila TaxID=1734049 RepID=A0A4R2SW90_9FIRM|nr:response regulator [Serpentinicella alkaliphila]QUH25569.1 response regulator [Serpentinicella alkaliphila]TCP94749.1 two-component system chemotaxis response regulator CheY [Serpentinicella alkaliphila]